MRVITKTTKNMDLDVCLMHKGISNTKEIGSETKKADKV